jgi:hypothetical protein
MRVRNFLIYRRPPCRGRRHQQQHTSRRFLCSPPPLSRDLSLTVTVVPVPVLVFVLSSCGAPLLARSHAPPPLAVVLWPRAQSSRPLRALALCSALLAFPSVPRTLGEDCKPWLTDLACAPPSARAVAQGSPSALLPHHQNPSHRPAFSSLLTHPFAARSPPHPFSSRTSPSSHPVPYLQPFALSSFACHACHACHLSPACPAKHLEFQECAQPPKA